MNWEKNDHKKYTSTSSNHKLLRVPFGLSATQWQVAVQFSLCLLHAEWTGKQCGDYDLYSVYFQSSSVTRQLKFYILESVLWLCNSLPKSN